VRMYLFIFPDTSVLISKILFVKMDHSFDIVLLRVKKKANSINPSYRLVDQSREPRAQKFCTTGYLWFGRE